VSKRFITKEFTMTQFTTSDDSNRTDRSLSIAIDMGRDSWHLCISDGGKRKREIVIDRKNLDAGKSALLAEVDKSKAHFGLRADAPVHTLFEAGRDGFWFARWLKNCGFTCIIIDPSGIMVDRRAKHRKNDAIDSRALLELLVRHVSGERPLQPVEIPPAEAEDSREVGRLLGTLHGTRRKFAMRVQSLLWLQGIDDSYYTALPKTFDQMRTGDGRELGPVLRLELDLLCSQIEHLDREICKLEDLRVVHIKKPVTPVQVKAQALEMLVGIGPIGAWTLAHELFDWRVFQNGKQLGAFVGLSPMPYASGTMDRDQGISKAGSGPIRALLIQLGWSWLRYQPESALSQWYQTRFGETAKRSKRVGIVAVARKLLILLWRYVTQGVVPAGAVIKNVTHGIVAVRPRGANSNLLYKSVVGAAV